MPADTEVNLTIHAREVNNVNQNLPDTSHRYKLRVLKHENVKFERNTKAKLVHAVLISENLINPKRRAKETNKTERRERRK